MLDCNLIYCDKNALLMFTFRKKISTSFLFSRYVFSKSRRISRQLICFSMKLEQQSGLIFFFQNALRESIL